MDGPGRRGAKQVYTLLVFEFGPCLLCNVVF